MTSLSSQARSVLLPLSEVTRLPALRRSAILFAQGQRADSLYFVDEGLVKLTRTNERGNRIILAICGSGYVVGEEVFAEHSPSYYAEAEVLTGATVFRIPREALMSALSGNPELASALIGAVIEQKNRLAERVELLCLHDVEHRILHYLAALASLVKPSADGDGYQLPITQLELADLVGATRETTSTTLNQLERRGLVRLSRRLMTIPSPITLRSAASDRFSPNGAAAVATASV